MRRSISILILALATNCFAQVEQKLQFTPTDSVPFHQLHDRGNGNVFIGAQTDLGPAATRWSMMWCDTSYQVTQKSSFNFSIPRVLLRSTLVMGDHYLMCGVAVTQAGQKYPNLLNVAGGSVDHSVFLSNLLFNQNELISVQRSNDTILSLYTASSDLRPAFYRINTKVDTPLFSSVIMTANTAIKFRMTTTAEANSPSVHWVGGTAAFDSDPSDRLAMIAKVVPTGVLWSRAYDMGSENIQFEEVRGMAQLSDGAMVAVIQYADTMGRKQSAVLKVTANGVPIWCIKLHNAAGQVKLGAIHERADSTLLVAGGSGGNEAVLVELSPSGSLMGQHKMVGSGNQSTAFGSLIQLEQAHLTLSTEQFIVEIRTDVQGCDIQSYSDIASDPYTPVIQTVLLDNDPFTVLDSPLQATLVTHPIDLVEDCIFTSVEGYSDLLEQLIAIPNPANDRIMLSGMVVHPQEVVLIHDLQGKLVFRSNYQSGIDISALKPGVYLIELVERYHHPLRMIKL